MSGRLQGGQQRASEELAGEKIIPNKSPTRSRVLSYGKLFGEGDASIQALFKI